MRRLTVCCDALVVGTVRSSWLPLRPARVVNSSGNQKPVWQRKGLAIPSAFSQGCTTQRVFTAVNCIENRNRKSDLTRILVTECKKNIFSKLNLNPSPVEETRQSTSTPTMSTSQPISGIGASGDGLFYLKQKLSRLQNGKLDRLC